MRGRARKGAGRGIDARFRGLLGFLSPLGFDVRESGPIYRPKGTLRPAT